MFFCHGFSACATNFISNEFDLRPKWTVLWLKCTLPITLKFCKCYDSITAVAFAKLMCQRLSIFWIRALQILIEFPVVYTKCIALTWSTCNQALSCLVLSLSYHAISHLNCFPRGASTSQRLEWYMNRSFSDKGTAISEPLSISSVKMTSIEKEVHCRIKALVEFWK